MSKSSNPIIASLVTLLLVACQSVPEPVIEAQQPEAVTTTVIESAPSAQSEAETAAEPIDYPQQTYLAAIDALKNGDTEGAIELLTRVSREAPDKPRLFTNLGLAYFSLQQDELSEQAFQQAVKRDSNDAVAYNHLGILLRH